MVGIRAVIMQALNIKTDMCILGLKEGFYLVLDVIQWLLLLVL